MSYTATPDAKLFAMVVSTPTVLGDLYVLDAASGQRRQLTKLNEALFAELQLTPPEDDLVHELRRPQDPHPRAEAAATSTRRRSTR